MRDGKPWKITGNPEDPLSRGRLCPRGTGGNFPKHTLKTFGTPNSAAPRGKTCEGC